MLAPPTPNLGSGPWSWYPDPGRWLLVKQPLAVVGRAPARSAGILESAWVSPSQPLKAQPVQAEKVTTEASRPVLEILLMIQGGSRLKFVRLGIEDCPCTAVCDGYQIVYRACADQRSASERCSEVEAAAPQKAHKGGSRAEKPDNCPPPCGGVVASTSMWQGARALAIERPFTEPPKSYGTDSTVLGFGG